MEYLRSTFQESSVPSSMSRVFGFIKQFLLKERHLRSPLGMDPNDPQGELLFGSLDTHGDYEHDGGGGDYEGDGSEDLPLTSNGLLRVAVDTSQSPFPRNPSLVRRYSPVFRYFSASDEVPGIWLCNICRDTGLSFEKQHKWSSDNTTNWWRHLKKHHKVEHDLIAPRPSTQESSVTSVSSTGIEFSTEDATRATGVLARWIVTNSHPYAVVEQSLFREHSAILRSTYRVPCRQTIRDKILGSWNLHKGLVREQLATDLIGGKRWCATTDMWTSSGRRGYMVVTMHYIDNDWMFRSVILGFIRVVYPHTGTRLADHFSQAVNAMDSSLMSSFWCITADNASNNPVMVDRLNTLRQRHLNSTAPDPTSAPDAPRIVYLRCLAHVLQLAVKAGILKCPDMNVALGGLRDVVKRFQDSPKLFEKYELVCQSLGDSKARKFKLDVETRWNSTYDMVDHLLKAKDAIAFLALRIRLQVDHFREFKKGSSSRQVVGVSAIGSGPTPKPSHESDSWCAITWPSQQPLFQASSRSRRLETQSATSALVWTTTPSKQSVNCSRFCLLATHQAKIKAIVYLRSSAHRITMCPTPLHVSNAAAYHNHNSQCKHRSIHCI